MGVLSLCLAWILVGSRAATIGGLMGLLRNTLKGLLKYYHTSPLACPE